MAAGGPDFWCPKHLREHLCKQQVYAPDAPTVAAIDSMIAVLDEHRPLGPDGKHSDRHTLTCGCEDVPQAQRARRAHTQWRAGLGLSECPHGVLTPVSDPGRDCAECDHAAEGGER